MKDNSFKNYVDKSNKTMFLSLDGVDFDSNEPMPFNKRWFSRKLKTAGIRYDLGLSIRSSDIVWVSRGFPCREWPDVKIAREGIAH